MFTIDDYINSLKNDKETLVDNLETKGITGISDDNTFTELVPKVLDITLEPNNQNKQVTITSNTTTNVTYDSGYTGLGEVEITTNVQPDLSEYFDNSITSGSGANIGMVVKKLASPLTINGDITSLFYQLRYLREIPELILNNVTTTSSWFSSQPYITTVPLFDTSSVTNMSTMFNGCGSLTSVPLFNTSSVTNMSTMFAWCTSLTSVPLFNTSNVTNMANMFNGCTNLETIPLFNTSSVTNFQNTFTSCNSLTDTTLDNILQMCINATNYTGTKTLFYIGIYGNKYPSSRIQALPHYNDFTTAGWTIS